MPRPKELPEINEERFLKFIDTQSEDECWNWKGSRNIDGYGIFSVQIHKKKMKLYAHRVAVKVFRGALNLDLVVDHTCRNKACCNPNHLREVSVRINNTENSNSFSAINTRKTHCARGHEYSDENTVYRETGRTRRICRICRKEDNQRHYRYIRKTKKYKLSDFI